MFSYRWSLHLWRCIRRRGRTKVIYNILRSSNKFLHAYLWFLKPQRINLSLPPSSKFLFPMNNSCSQEYLILKLKSLSSLRLVMNAFAGVYQQLLDCYLIHRDSSFRGEIVRVWNIYKLLYLNILVLIFLIKSLSVDSKRLHILPDLSLYLLNIGKNVTTLSLLQIDSFKFCNSQHLF